MSRSRCKDFAVVRTDDGGELTYDTILHGLSAAIVASRAEVLWVAEDLTDAIWEGLMTERLPAHSSIVESTNTIRETLCSVGYSELAPYFFISTPVRHVSLTGCIHEPPLKDEEDFCTRVRASIRSSHLPGVRLLYVTGLSACENALETRELLLASSETRSLRSEIVALIRKELLRLPWRHSFQCYLA